MIAMLRSVELVQKQVNAVYAVYGCPVSLSAQTSQVACPFVCRALILHSVISTYAYPVDSFSNVVVQQHCLN